MKKKTLCFLLTVALASAFFTGCGSQSDNDAAPMEMTENKTDDSADEASLGEKITLKMAWWGSQERHDKTIAAIELYEKYNPGVDIEYEYYTFDDYFAKLKSLVASDEVWDIFQLGGNFPQYIDKIYPLDEFIESGVVDVSGFYDGNLKITQTPEGVQLGLTNGINTYGIAYEPELFEEAGAKLPDDNWTWDDYKEAADLITENIGIYGSSTFLTSEFIAGCSTYIAQQGDLGQYSFYNLDLTGVGFDDPQMLAPYIQMRADMIRKGSYPDTKASAAVTNIENDFLVTGEAAMTWVAVNQFPTIYDICKEQGRTLALATVPKVTPDGNSGARIQSSQMLCVSQDSDYKDAAAAFIGWFETNIDCNRILQAERGIPANEAVRSALAVDATEGQQLMYEYVAKISKLPTPKEIQVLSPDGHDRLVENYINYIQQVANGEITAEIAADKTYEDAVAIFK